MKLRYIGYGVVLVCSLMSACKKNDSSEKMSPNTLIALLSKGGSKIEKAGSFTNQPPAEMNMKLNVDGQEDIVATRFPTPKLAADYCEIQAACFTIAHWSIEAFANAAKTAQWEKLLTVGKETTLAAR